MPGSVVTSVSAPADLSTSETPTPAAGPSVLSTQTAPPPWPVSTNTVLTPVLESAASMRSVESSTTILSAPVYQDTSETPSEAAVWNVSTA